VTLYTIPGGEIATLTPAGDLGDDDVDTGIASLTTPAIDGVATTEVGALALSYYGDITGIAIRALMAANSTGFAPAWIAASDAIRWRVGAGSFDEETNAQNASIVIPKTGSFDWSQTSTAWTQPNGDPWDVAAVNALEVAARVEWSPELSGTVQVRLVEARVIVYGVMEAEARAVAVGVTTPAVVVVGDVSRAVAVGATDPVAVWVGEEEE